VLIPLDTLKKHTDLL